MLVRLKGGFLGPEKKIFTDGGQSSLSTAIRELPALLEQISNARYREYLLVMRNSQNYILFAPTAKRRRRLAPGA